MDFFDDCCAVLASGGELFCFGFIGKTLADSIELPKAKIDRVIVLWHKSRNRAFALNQQGQRGRHDPTHIQFGAVQQREVPGGVDAHQPVRLGSAQGAFVQPIEVRAGTKILKSIPDGFILHRGNPQPFHRLLAVSQIVDTSENQLALPSSIAGVDNFGHILPAHQLLQDGKLIPLIGGNLKAEGARQDGQILPLPFGVAFIVHAGIRKPRQMAKTPRYNIFLSFQIAVLSSCNAQNPG